MQFLMLVCGDTVPVDAPTEPAGAIDDWLSTMQARGVRLAGGRA